jgi:penicillin-binding protein 2
VQRSHERVYPWENVEVTLDRTTLPPPLRSEKPITITLHGVADHLLGSMRDETWAGDIERRPLRDQVSGSIVDRGGYVPGDAVGARGLERAFEDHLRGLRGVVHERLDTGERTRTPHVPGQDLVLTIDIALQARVHATLSPEYGLAVVQPWQAPWNSDGSPRPTILPLGTALPAAAAVVDVETGQILALVSTPTIAESQRLPPCRREGYAGIVNRALEAIYPPGSIIKPLVLAAAVTEGAHGLDEPVECRGHYLPDREDVLRCWVYRPPRTDAHGEVRAAEALARSCNVYFYTLADHLGFERLVHWYERFGLGRPIDVGLGLPIEDESAWRGRLPRTGPGADVAATYGSLRFATVSMGIGQGPVTWTVLHAAAAYATLARFGDPLRLTLLRDDPRGTTSAEIDVGPLDERLVRTILEGLRQSVAAEHGTGHHIRYPGGRVEPILNVPGVTVWAKTGTAEAPPPALDLDCDGRPDPPRDDPAHAWFVGLVGAAAPGAGDEAARDARSEERAVPRYAIAVLVEHGGSGGRTAGPIANEIIRALVAEGYLPGDRP